MRMRTSAARPAARRAAPLSFAVLPVLVAWGGAWACGCGGAAPPPPVAAAPKLAPPPAPPPPELSAVPDPAGLVLSGGLAKVGASLAVVHSWSKLPMPQSEQLTELLTGEAIGPVVDVEQPLYFAVTVVGSGMRMKPPLVAVSAAVKDPDKVRAALAERYRLVPGSNGATLIEGLGRASHGSHAAADPDAQDDEDRAASPGGAGVSGPGDTGADGPDDDDGRTCELAPAIGDAPVRIVCGASAQAVTDLGPWLTRTAPRAAPAADLHAEVRMAPLQQTIAEAKRLVGMLLGTVLSGGLRAAWAKELMVAVATDAADFASDLDGLSLDVSLASTGATERATLKLSGSTSVIARGALAHAERSGPAPAALWAMPADADVALFTRGVDEDTLANARQVLVDALAGGLVEGGAKPGDASAVASAFGRLFTGAPFVYAAGMDVDAAGKALAAEKALGDSADRRARGEGRRATAESILGWRLIETERPTSEIVGALKAVSAAMSRPSLVAALRAEDRSVSPPALRPSALAKTAGLPASATHWVLEIPMAGHKDSARGDKAAPRKATPAPRPLLVHLIVVPDGQRTWLALGADEQALASKLAGLKGGAHLDSRPEFAGLKTTSVATGGFLTAKRIEEQSLELNVVGGAGPAAAGEAIRALQQMPNKGASPIVMWTTAAPGALTLEATAPVGAFEDLIWAYLQR